MSEEAQQFQEDNDQSSPDIHQQDDQQNFEGQDNQQMQETDNEQMQQQMYNQQQEYTQEEIEVSSESLRSVAILAAIDAAVRNARPDAAQRLWAATTAAELL